MHPFWNARDREHLAALFSKDENSFSIHCTAASVFQLCFEEKSTFLEREQISRINFVDLEQKIDSIPLTLAACLVTHSEKIGE